METVCEHETPPVLEEERLRMQMNVNRVAADTVPPMRGVRRFKSNNPGGKNKNLPNRNMIQRASSMRAQRPLAPTRSMDAAASFRGNAVSRANSSRVLARKASNNNNLARRGGPPGRTSSAQGQLRPFSRDQIVNTAIGGMPPPKEHSFVLRAPSGTLQRHESDMSLGDISISEGSLFTMDSVCLRKGQMVADPLEEGTYDEDDSFADHESFMTREPSFMNHCPGAAMQQPTVLTFGDLEELRLTQKLQISAEETSTISFSDTLASGLTTDFSHSDSEYAFDEKDYAE